MRRRPSCELQGSQFAHPNTTAFKRMFHWLLVIAQFVLSATVVLSARWSPLPVVALVVASPGIGLAVWAWVKVGLTKIRVHPTTTDATQLMTDGPYAFVRHPMYTGLIWFTAALLFDPFHWWRVAAWLGIVLVLYVKSSHEERMMQDRFPTYDTYRKRVGRLFPMFGSF